MKPKQLVESNLKHFIFILVLYYKNYQSNVIQTFMYAYVLTHFGSNIKYLEYEIYTVLMLQSISNYDIVYLYNSADTPEIFAETMKNLNVKVKKYDDTIISKYIEMFKSKYEHFNTLKTCQFIYAYLLEEYEKVCIVESDMIFVKGFENVFNCKAPAILYYAQDVSKHHTNHEIQINSEEILKVCNTNSNTNGGIMLFVPDKKMFKKYVELFEKIITNQCVYPNETLFLIGNKKIYNLPMKFNYSHYKVTSKNKHEILNYHFHNTTFKVVDIIKDDYIEKLNRDEKVKNIVRWFKKNFYDNHNVYVSSILNKIALIQNNKN